MKLIAWKCYCLITEETNENIDSKFQVNLFFLKDEVDEAKKLKTSKNGSSAHDDESNGAEENGAEEEEDLDEEGEEALGEEEEGDGEEDLDEAEGEEGEGGLFLSTSELCGIQFSSPLLWNKS